VKRVLFICIHNSARSQMAEAFANALPGVEAHSAGLEPGRMNPVVVEVMKEVGIDLSSKGTQSVFEVATRGEHFDQVISVCDEAAEQCPVFPGKAEKLAWSFPDPSRFEGSDEERREATRKVRDAIREKIERWGLMLR
jgi:arsenate reductase